MARPPGKKIKLLALAALLLAHPVKVSADRQNGGRRILPFSLADVELTEGTDFKEGMDLNLRYLLDLDPDRLLFMFRATAGMDTRGAEGPYGGWEGRDVEVRGQFIGHYLSAIAFAYKNTGREDVRARGEEMVAGLLEVQAAWGDGYLAAFPPSFFDRLEALIPVWVPYYVVHKLMAGLLDQAQLAGSGAALAGAVAMKEHFCARARRVIAVNGTDRWLAVLNTEFGGMNEVLYKLYQETGDADAAACAALFDKPNFFGPLAAGEDALPGRHANTHLAQVNGFGARFEATGDAAAAAAVENFFALALQHHTYSTGGSNWYEGWHGEDSLGDAVIDTEAGVATQESCTQYNILKVARYIFTWSGSPAVADFYERAVLNGVIGIQRRPHDHSSHGHDHSRDHSHHDHHGHSHHEQHHLGLAGGEEEEAEDGARGRSLQEAKADQGWGETAAGEAYPPPAGPGVMIYFTPLGPPTTKGDNTHQWNHGWGSPNDSFWCCYGTAVESFAKLADSIYFHRPAPASPGLAGGGPAPPPELFVNQLVSSRLRWREAGVELTLEANIYPKDDNVATATLLIRATEQAQQAGGSTHAAGAARRFLLHWRIPSWALAAGLQVTVNGVENAACAAAAERGEGGGGSGGLGAGAAYCTLGPDWQDGDVVMAALPMRVATEDLNDARPAMRSLKAILLGPLAMAALTEGGRDLEETPSDIPSLVGPVPDASDLVSLAPSAVVGGSEGGAGGGGVYLRSREGAMAWAKVHSRADAMASTFRLRPALAGCEGGADATRQSPCEEAWAHGRPLPRLASFEGMSQPGQYLTHDPETGGMVLRPAAAELRAAQTFALRREGGSVWLQPLSASGGAACVRVPPLGGGDGAGEGAGCGPALRLASPAAGEYPRGARVLRGRRQQYLLVPIGQVQDERYAAYLNFVPPPGVEAAAEAAGAAAEAADS